MGHPKEGEAARLRTLLRSAKARAENAEREAETLRAQMEDKTDG